MKHHPDRSWFKRTSMAAIVAGLLVAVLGLVANPASAHDGTADPFGSGSTKVDIGAGDNGDDVGDAWLKRSDIAGTDTLQVHFDVPGGFTETHLCLDDAPFTERIAPGQCQYADGVDATTGGYEIDLTTVSEIDDDTESIDFSASQVCVQLHFAGTTIPGPDGSSGNTAFAGHVDAQQGFYGNVCLPVPPVEEECEEDEVLNEETGECEPIEEDPEAVLDASITCGANGLTVTITNTGDAAGQVDVKSGETVVGDDVAVPANGSTQVAVPVAEDALYDIEVVGVAEFAGTRDCEDVLPVVIPKTPETPVTPEVLPTQVAGVQVTRAAAQELPRTGNTTLPLIQVGLGLMLMGAGALIIGKDQTASI